MIKEILTYPSKRLRQKSEHIKVEEIKSKDIQTLALDLIETMFAKDGIGLAAPQVGRTVRMVVINEKNGPIVLINPKILKSSWRKAIDEEGCLSVPGVWGKVKRNHKITVEAYFPNGDKIQMTAQGMLARVIQHEVDHLDGILFIDKVIQPKKAKMNEM